MPFKKGQSGNPKGRKPGTLNKNTRELKDLAGKYGPEALDKLVALMRGSDPTLEALAKQLTRLKKIDEGGKLAKVLFHIGVALEGRVPAVEAAAAREILDRAYGKPAQHKEITQTVEHTGTVTHRTEPVSEFDSWLAEAAGGEAAGQAEAVGSNGSVLPAEVRPKPTRH